MLDKRRIRLMTKLAVYEQSGAKEDLKISSYYKKDYIGLKTVIGAIWATIGYGMIAALAVLCNIEPLLEDLSMRKLIMLAVAAVGGYVAVLIVYCVCAGAFYGVKHKRASMQIKKFYHNLSRLEQLDSDQPPKKKVRRRKKVRVKEKTEENGL